MTQTYHILYLRYTLFYVRIPFVSGSVGMADELDSGSSVGYYVWVQVPSSALKRKDLGKRLGLFFCIGASLEPKVQSLRSAPVGAKQTSTGRLAPHLPHVSITKGVSIFFTIDTPF